jgi:hypothetical protein
VIGVYLQSSSMTAEQYHEIEEKLTSAIGGVWDGLIMHTCFREGPGLAIFDVWESEEKFEALAPILMPMVAELNVEMSPPQFVEMIAYQVMETN